MEPEEFDLLPQEVKDILEIFDENNGDLYKQCQIVIDELEKIGWTADYDLSGTLYDIRKMR